MPLHQLLTWARHPRQAAGPPGRTRGSQWGHSARGHRRSSCRSHSKEPHHTDIVRTGSSPLHCCALLRLLGRWVAGQALTASCANSAEMRSASAPPSTLNSTTRTLLRSCRARGGNGVRVVQRNSRLQTASHAPHRGVRVGVALKLLLLQGLCALWELVAEEEARRFRELRAHKGPTSGPTARLLPSPN
jgi:hypothetical protein